MKLPNIILCAVLSGSPALALGQVSFTDTFNPPSSLWSNTSGNWTASGGSYYAQQPNNNPFAATWLPFDVTDLTINVHVDNLADGGILLRGSGLAGGGGNGPVDTVDLILGGGGYGQGVRGGNAGSSAYWHVDGSGATDQANGVFVPGGSYDLKITVVGDTYSLYVDGSANPATTLTTSLNPHGYVGLYDDQPNTSTGSGTGLPMTFSDFSLVATPVPEPSALAALALGTVSLLARRRRQAGV